MSGMAGKVRRATDSDEFDLANYDQARCDELVQGAFSEPLPLSNMVKLSFVVGGGKLVRQKYTDDLPKIFMSSLAAKGGYQDDNSASLEASSGGKFKFQHDTEKNLKFVHVFPRISPPAQTGAGGAEGEEDEEEDVPQTPEDILLTCNMEYFKDLVARQLETYGQKKRLQHLLKARISKLEEIEAKMTRLQQLTAEEQTLFDGVGVEDIKEKSKVLSGELKGMVDAGRLTSAEKSGLLEQLDSQLAAVEAEINKAEADGKQKKAQALQQQVEAIRGTQTAVKGCSALSLPPLKHSQNIKKYYGKIAELNRIEKASKGHYTVEELRRIGEKPEIEEAIEELQTRSRGWLEADEIFEERVKACKGSASAAAKKAPPPPGGGGYAAAASRPSAGASGSGYSTVSRGKPKPKAGKGAGPPTRNAFSLLDP